ncbi:MAG: hypothetical protein SGI74_11465 [Oligoflexia bacterium]|nr:hypothetical protein [Oligoflexia bacterium]
MNGTLLHSSVNPEKEAISFIDAEWSKINSLKSLIVLGVGGGFHIRELLKRKKFHIVIIDSNRELVDAIIEKQPEFLGSAEILAGVPPAQICREPSVIKALSGSYCILRHPASVRVAPFYYTAISQILNQRTLTNLRELSQGNIPLQRFLESLNIASDQILTLPMVEEAMSRRQSEMEKEGLIWMAMRELVL